MDNPHIGFPFGHPIGFRPFPSCVSIAQAFGKESESGVAVGLAQQSVTRKLSPSVIWKERPWLLDVACIFLLTLCIVACRKYTMWKAGKSRISCRSRCEPGQPRVALCWHIASNAPSSSEVEFRVVQIPGGCGELNTSKRVWCRRNLQTGEYQLRIPF